jgi:hypothetical protein
MMINKSGKKWIENKKELTEDGQLLVIIFGSGGWIRTNDLRVMSPTSYLTAPPRIKELKSKINQI